MTSAQKRAVDTYRSRLKERGLVRFEVLGRAEDRDLIRHLARSLAEKGEASTALRAQVESSLSEQAPGKGNILKALRASPLVASDLDLERERESGRKVDL
ncbi:MAG: hypothetical protein AAFY02_02800 [Pseudomonadota bacterium]